jgi:hypothetical protein
VNEFRIGAVVKVIKFPNDKETADVPLDADCMSERTPVRPVGVLKYKKIPDPPGVPMLPCGPVGP